jgi:hypothetical protein
MPLIGPQPTITTFDAPGAGTGAGQGTLPFGINPAGTVLGYYIDAGDAAHGFLRTPNGAITTFDPPGAGTGPGQGTNAFSITPAGAIAGRYSDASSVFHGSCALRPVRSLLSTSLVLAQVLARVPAPQTSTRRGRSRQLPLTRAMCFTVSCALRTAR